MYVEIQIGLLVHKHWSLNVCPDVWLHEATSSFTKLLFCNASLDVVRAVLFVAITVAEPTGYLVAATSSSGPRFDILAVT